MRVIGKALLVGLIGATCFWAGYTTRIDPNKPIDIEGYTTITVIFGNPDGNNWCELRGPARYAALEYFGTPDDSIDK